MPPADDYLRYVFQLLPAEQIILRHVRNYFRTHHDRSIEEIRRVQVELEPLTTADQRRVVVHLLTEEDPVGNLTFEITQEQEPRLFEAEHQHELYFLQGLNEKNLLQSTERQLKDLVDKRCSSEQFTLDGVRTMLQTYADRTFSTYSREECMRIAIEYRFDDLLDELHSLQIEAMLTEIQTRLQAQIERRRV